MSSAPKAVIHINFLPGELLFDARPIWSALLKASQVGRVSPDLYDQLGEQFGGMAIHLGTRDYMLRAVVRELKAGISSLCDLIPDAISPGNVGSPQVFGGDDAENSRDRILVAIDSFLFEFRAFLELMAKFAYGVLSGIGRQPSVEQRLSTGRKVNVTDRKGVVRPNDFLLYLCDTLQVSIDWYTFLSTHRNFFTHQGAPYCAIEHRLMAPAEYDLLIMRTNIHDFSTADPKDYFRVSECASVLTGVKKLGAAVQRYLIDSLP